MRNDPVQVLAMRTGKSLRELFAECYPDAQSALDNFQGYIFDGDLPLEMETYARQELVELKRQRDLEAA